MTETTQHQHAGNAGDSEYDAYLARVRARFGASTSLGPLFTTNVAPAALWANSARPRLHPGHGQPSHWEAPVTLHRLFNAGGKP